MSDPSTSGAGLAGALDFLGALDDGGDEQFLELSRQLINNLFVLLRSAGMHDLKNDALNRPLAQMATSVNGFARLFSEDVYLQLVDGNFFVNQRMVKLDFATFENVRYLRRIFEFLSVNEVVFTEKVDHVSLRSFLEVFLDAIHSGSSLDGTDLGAIRLRNMQAKAFDELRRASDPRNRVLGVYAGGLLMLRQFVNDLRKGRAPRHAKVKRLCLELIDQPPRLHNMLLALIHLETYKGNLFCHMLNTAVMAIVFGRRLGLNRRQLTDLGMAAFHHDLGWALLGTLGTHGQEDGVALTMAGINDARTGTRAEMDELRVKVAQALVKLGGFNELVINRLIVAYECQVPEEDPADNLYYDDIGASFMTHVVRMASAYDEMTTPERRGGMLLPDQAMRRILDDGGQSYSPFLAKLFANCIGAYPVGSMVELDTTEIAVVVNLPTNPVNFHRPQVRVLIDRQGRAVTDGPIVDLSETARSGRYMRTIERALDSRKHGLSITHFFFG